MSIEWKQTIEGNWTSLDADYIYIHNRFDPAPTVTLDGNFSIQQLEEIIRKTKEVASAKS